MNVAIMKTKAEQALSEQFEAMAEHLPGTGWARDVRAAAIGEFEALGLPHRRIEEWKYTDLRNLMKEAYKPAVAPGRSFDWSRLGRALGPALSTLDCIRLVFVNGFYIKQPDGSGDVASARGLYHFTPLAEAIGQAEFDWMKPHFLSEEQSSNRSVLALNTAFVSDGAVLRIEDGADIPVPIHLVFVSDTTEPESTAIRNLIKAGDGARCVILESHVGVGAVSRQSNAVTELHVGESAHVQHVKLLDEGAGATHLANWLIQLGKNSVYRGFQLTAGAALARNQTQITFAGDGAKLDFSGVFLARGHNHVDTTLLVDHAVPHCESRELFKGVIDNSGRGIFQGKIIVRPDAQKTDGKQMAQALMLSPDAEFDTKPELEIYADDVVCGHGATAAELDDDLLFYCMSRGIPLDEARALLIQSFIGEAIDRVEHDAVREAMRDCAHQWLRPEHHAKG